MTEHGAREQEIREQEIRAYYRQAARTDRPDRGDGEPWGRVNYDDGTLMPGAELDEGTAAAARRSMGCGNPFALVDLQPGDEVLDLGSGGGLDVILSARRVAPGGRAYGVDFLPEMLELARANVARAGVGNVELLEGRIDDLPLPDTSVDVVLSNCVINLASDKGLVFAEMVRVLRPGGRVAVSDLVADEGYRPPADGRQWADCGAGALPPTRYRHLLEAAGLTGVTIELTGATGPGLHAALIRAVL